MKARIFAVLVSCVTCAVVLVGCSASTTSQVSDAQAQNRQYMASVNQIMDSIGTDMEGFVTAIQGGEVISLSSQLSSVSASIEQLKALEVPEAMKDIQASYVTGAEELLGALNAYVELYQDIQAPESGSFDFSTYASRLAEVQERYDMGMAALQEADTKAAAA